MRTQNMVIGLNLYLGSQSICILDFEFRVVLCSAIQLRSYLLTLFASLLFFLKLRNKWHKTSLIYLLLINETSKWFIYLLCSLIMLMFTYVGTEANARSSAGSSIKLSISHLFFLICAATVASIFTTYWASQNPNQRF